MEEKNLLKVALICSIIGIFIIFIFANRLEPSLVNISDVSASLLDQSVKIQGAVDSIRITPSVIILSVKDDSGSIKVVAFSQDNSELVKGQLVEILGDVTEYKGILEIEAKKVSFSGNSSFFSGQSL